MRTSYLVINKQDFKRVVEGCGVPMSDYLIDTIFVSARQFAPELKVSHDVMVSHTRTLESENYKLFNSLLTVILKEKHNPHATEIMVQDSAFNTMREVCTLAEDFCNKNGLSLREGFIEYINIGLTFMGKNYGINKFKYYNSKINEKYLADKEVSNDPNKTLSSDIKEYYEYKNNIKCVPSDMIHFVRAAAQILSIDANPQEYLSILFSRFEFMGNLTEPSQLYGEGAVDFYYKNRHKIEKSTPDSCIDYEEQRLMEAKQRAAEKREKLIKEL